MDISDFVKKAKEYNVLGIKISKDNELAAEWYSEPECRRNIYSATKSFTSCAVGFAVQEGLIDLNEKLTEAFSDDLPECIDENLKEATVRDLLTMCLGQEKGSLMGEQRPLYEEDNWVKMSLAIPFKYKPGTHFVYNNVGPYLAGILVQRRSGCDLVSYLTPRLFAKLGIKRPTWETDPLGNSFGAGGLFLTLSELHKFGLFYLNKGKWNGKQILSEKWIEESTKAADVGYYGYLFWRGEYNSFRDGRILSRRPCIKRIRCRQTMPNLQKLFLQSRCRFQRRFTPAIPVSVLPLQRKSAMKLLFQAKNRQTVWRKMNSFTYTTFFRTAWNR